MAQFIKFPGGKELPCEVLSVNGTTVRVRTGTGSTVEVDSARIVTRPTRAAHWATLTEM
jgi:hypothetical protein